MVSLKRSHCCRALQEKLGQRSQQIPLSHWAPYKALKRYEAAHSCSCILQIQPPKVSVWMSSLLCQGAIPPSLSSSRRGFWGPASEGFCSYLPQKKLASLRVCLWIWVCSREEREPVETAFPIIPNFCLCSTKSPLSFSSVCVCIKFMNNPSHKIP